MPVSKQSQLSAKDCTNEFAHEFAHSCLASPSQRQCSEQQRLSVATAPNLLLAASKFNFAKPAYCPRGPQLFQPEHCSAP
jgi:hypothetical protein